MKKSDLYNGILAALAVSTILIGCSFSGPEDNLSIKPTKETTEWHERNQMVPAQKTLDYDPDADKAWAREQLKILGFEVPKEYKPLFKKYGEKYSISPAMLEAIAYCESRFDSTAENGPCKGLMQTNIKYWPNNWTDPDSNIKAACECIKAVVNTYGCEDLGSIMSYYHGEGSDQYSDYTENIDEISRLLEEAE